MIVKRLIRGGLKRLGYRLVDDRPRNGPRLELLRFIVGDLVRRRSNEATEPGWVVQVGANDGVRNDPIHRAVTELGLPALMIEPQPEMHAKLVESYADRPAVVCERLAIAEASGEKTLWRLDPERAQGAKFLNGTASFNRDHVAMFARKFKLPEDAVQGLATPCMPLAHVLERHGIKRVLLLLIDVEGFDDRVLHNALDSGLRPDAVQWEHEHLSYERQHACREKLASLGYRLTDYHTDTIAVAAAAIAVENHAPAPQPPLRRVA